MFCVDNIFENTNIGISFIVFQTCKLHTLIHAANISVHTMMSSPVYNVMFIKFPVYGKVAYHINVVFC